MKNTLFENWLRTKVEQSEQSFDHDAEWALLRPKLEKKKRKRRPVFWFLLPIGFLAVSYFFFTRDSKEESLAGIVGKDNIIIADSKVVDKNSIADPLNASSEQGQEQSNVIATRKIQDQEVGGKPSKQNAKSVSNSPAVKNDLSRLYESNYLYKNIKIFPNPVSDKLTILFSDEIKNNIQVNLFSLDGRVVDGIKLNQNSITNNYELNVKDLNDGVYFLNITDNVYRLNYKIIKN